MQKLDYESWEAQFLELCRVGLDEEPLYPFDKYYDKGLSPQEGFKKYLDENPDYAEKFQELFGDSENISYLDPATQNITNYLKKVAIELSEKERSNEALKTLERFCPNCAREIGTKKICKCGYRRKKA